jgi:hypothetical protein
VQKQKHLDYSYQRSFRPSARYILDQDIIGHLLPQADGQSCGALAIQAVAWAGSAIVAGITHGFLRFSYDISPVFRQFLAGFVRVFDRVLHFSTFFYIFLQSSRAVAAAAPSLNPHPN